jgi:hypothetical protein
MVDRLVNNEFGRIWKEAITIKSRYCPGSCLWGLWGEGGTIKSLRIAGAPAEIRNEHILYINPERYRYTGLLGHRHSVLNIQVWNLKSLEFDPHLANNVDKTKQVSLSKHTMRSNNMM